MVSADLRKALADLKAGNLELQRQVHELVAKVKTSKLRVAELERDTPSPELLERLRKANEDLGRRAQEQHETIASVREQLLADQDSGPLYCAVFDFVPREDKELPLSVSDAVSLEEEFYDGWGYGENIAQGKFGFFPMSCVSENPLPSDVPATAKPKIPERDDSRKYIPRVERVATK